MEVIGDVDDGTRPAVIKVGALMQQRQEGSGSKKDLGDVGPPLLFTKSADRIFEVFLLELLGIPGVDVAGCGGNAGVVDQEM